MAEQYEVIHDPPTLNPRGRPRTQRLTNTEGRARGDGGDVEQRRSAGDNRNRRCGLCPVEGQAPTI